MDHQQHCYPAAPTARWERPLPQEVIPPHLWHEKLNILICFGKIQIQIYGQSRPQTWNILPSVVVHVHHVISKDPNLCEALTSLWKQTEIWGGGWFVRVQRAHWGHHPSASHQRKRLQKFELWTTSVHSGVYHLLVRFPRATARRRNRRGLIVRADRQCQQLHPSTVQKVTGVSRSLLTHHSATLPGGGNLKLTPLRFIQAVKQNMDVCYKSRRN